MAKYLDIEMEESIKGWHLRSDSEWKILELHARTHKIQTDNKLVIGAYKGYKMKSTTNWFGNEGRNLLKN